MTIKTQATIQHQAKSRITYVKKELSPENTGKENRAVLQEMLDRAGTVRIEKPGVYEVEDMLIIKSHTHLILGSGVCIKRVSSSADSFFLMNEGALTCTFDENITIEGLHLITNGVEARDNKTVYGMTGELSFFYVKHLRIYDFVCLDLPKLSFGIHICTFEDLIIERIHIEGKKDAVHLGKGNKFVIRDGLFRTFDDPIALNAHDYSVANPQMGWIENGLIENCYDLNDNETTGYFCRILAGAWCDWYEGMIIQNSDTVVNQGRVYRAFQKPDGTKYRSITPPVHKKGMETQDKINWVMVQEEVVYQCGCRNIHFKDIHLQKKRKTALSIHFDHDRYSRSVYPGARMPVQQNLVFENLIVENQVDCLVRCITPVDCIKVIHSVIGNNKIQLECLQNRQEDYEKAHVMLIGNTFTQDGKTELVRCDDGRSCCLTGEGNIALCENFVLRTAGKVSVNRNLFRADKPAVCKRIEMKYRLSDDKVQWAEEIWKKLQLKIDAESSRIGNMIPGDVQNGHYSDMGSKDIFWWTNGFWAGILWQMFHATGKEDYKVAAEEIEEKLDQALMEFWGLHHDVGFMWLHSAAANYRLTGNKKSLNRGIHAATILSGRYNPNGKFIRAWNPECDPSLDTRGIAIIDCMMNIPLLYWAADVTKDSRFQTIAMSHADTVLAYSIRPDGSCNHIVVFDPDTGEYIDNPGGQGYGSGSSWSRGQGWALYGMALSYYYTGEQRYLDASKSVAHYFIANAALHNYVPLCDFRSPEEPKVIDTTAGVIAACGLLEIAKHVGELEKKLYIDSAIRILQAMEPYCDWNPETDAVLGYGTVSYHGKRHYPIIYGDYFLLEAVLRLLDRDFMIW